MLTRHSLRLLTSLSTGMFCLMAIGAWEQASGQSSASPGPLVYIGTYTGPTSKGIYVSRLNLESGVLSAPELAAETPSPSFLAARPQGDFLYAVNEVDHFQGKSSGSVSAFAINHQTGKLTLLNQQPSGGGGPAHLAVDRAGSNVLVANYGGGSIEVLPVDRDGRLKAATAFVQHTGSSVNPDRQKEPHAHYINVDPVRSLCLRRGSRPRQNPDLPFRSRQGHARAERPGVCPVKPGAGPRHLAMDAQGPVRLPHQRDGLHDHRVRPETRSRVGSRKSRPSRRCHKGKQCFRPTAPPKCSSIRREVPVWLQPRSRLDRRLRDRRAVGTSDLRAAPAHARKHPARIRHRSDRRVSAGGQSEV